MLLNQLKYKKKTIIILSKVQKNYYNVFWEWDLKFTSLKLLINLIIVK